MGKLSFILRPAKGEGAKIQLFYNYGTNKRFRYSTGYSIKNSINWNYEEERIRRVAEETQKKDINNKLDLLQELIESKYEKLDKQEQAKVTNDFFKELCDGFFNKNSSSKEIEIIELLPFYSWFNKNYSIKPLISTGKPLGKGTAKTYKNAYKLLERFCKEKYRVYYKKIDNGFYDDFLDWLYGQNYSTNYIGTQIKILKTMMSASFELGHHTNTEFERKYFKKPSEQVDNIFLNQDELQKIFELNFSKVKSIKISKSLVLSAVKLDTARDLFLISSNTGLRVSDFNRLSIGNILIRENGDKVFQIIMRKNGKAVSIPINTMVNKILDKRNGNPPKAMPEQHINYALKEIGRIAEIDSPVTKVITKGGKEFQKVYKKYELISNHTGRRSFCTNAYLSEMPTIDIMAISGHSSEKVFYSYIKVNDLQRAIKIGKYKFFK